MKEVFYMAAGIDSNFRKIITGSISYNSSQLAMGLLITRLKSNTAKSMRRSAQ
jgi:hypothetical protein